MRSLLWSSRSRRASVNWDETSHIFANRRSVCNPARHLLKNRFYLGEVAYRGEIHPGEHQPILDRALSDAVQTRLKEQAVERSAIAANEPWRIRVV
jgi:hypothetical protein